MKRIRSIKGDINSKELGVCQCHEHLFLADGASRQVNAALYMDDFGKSCAEARMFRLAGGNSFIDAQPFRCGRMGELTLALCNAVGLNAICCTGFHKTEFFEQPEWLEAVDEDELARAYIGEITDGMEASDRTRINAKAGLIKCALTGDGIEENTTYAKLFRAARWAACETGAPVYVHLDGGADATSLLRFMNDGGISSNRIILCHLDRARYDFGYHEEIAQTGAYLEYDTIRREKYHSDAEEIKLISYMVGRGYGGNLLLGMDETNLRLKSYGAPFGMDYILTDFKYQMEREGIDNKIFMRIMKENAANALEFEQ